MSEIDRHKKLTLLQLELTRKQLEYKDYKITKQELLDYLDKLEQQVKEI